MRRNLVIMVSIIGILVLGSAAVYLSVKQDQNRKALVPDRANTIAETTGLMPTPTLQTAPSVNIEDVTTIDITHTVRIGETLSDIALFYDVQLDDIINANSLDNPDLLDAGQQLTVPGIHPTPVPQMAGNPAGGQEITILPKPDYVAVNGLTESQFIIMDHAVLQQARDIYLRGQQMGRNPGAFSVVGDSTTEIPFFLARFDQGPYELGDYAYLQSVIDQFSGSYSRDSVAVRVGLHSYTLFDPIWADKAICLPNEAVLACEIRLHNPSIILLRLGSNDVGIPELFDESMRQAVQYAVDNGVIPVMGTKADRFEGSNQNNEILREIASDFKIPLWDYDLVAGTIDGRGLDVDGVHMTTFYPHDYTQSDAYQRGHAMHNLTALMMLDTIWKEVILSSNLQGS